MRNLLVYPFLLVAIVALLSGCGDDSATQLERDSAGIVKQAIVNNLNTQINASYGNLAFLLAPAKVMLISPGVSQATNSSGEDSFKPLDVITIARKYNATKITYDVVGVSHSQIRKKNDSRYPYQAKLTILINATYEVYHDVNAFSLQAIVPVEWSAQRAEKQEDFIKDFYTKLPPVEFDYRVIAESPTAETETRREQWSIDIVWNKSEKRWELGDKAPDMATTVKASSPSWLGAVADDEAVKKFLDAQGFVSYQEKRFRSADIEIFKKIEQGLIFLDGKWQDPRVIDATMEFKIALDRWNQHRSFSDLAVMLKELNRLSGTESFSDHARIATAGILNAVKSMELRADEKSLEQLAFFMKNNSSFSAIEPQRVLGAIVAARTNIDQRKLDKYQRELTKELEAMRRQLDSRLELQKAIEPYAPEQLTPKTIVEFGSFQKYAETEKSVKMYLALLGIVLNRPALLEKYGNLSDPMLADLYQPCSTCQGKGNRVCRVCRGSGVCQTCGGRGEMYSKRVSGEYETAPCPRACAFCPKNPTCSSCNGTGQAFFVAKARKRIVDFYAEIMKDLNDDIEKRRAKIVKQQEMIDSGVMPPESEPQIQTPKATTQGGRIQDLIAK